MEINVNGRSLKLVFFQYLLSIAVGLVVAIGLSIFLLTLSYQLEVIVPANETEHILLEKKDHISAAEEFDVTLLPDKTSYLLLSEDGRFLASNMSEDIQDKALDFHHREGIATTTLSFMEIRRPGEYVVIGYSLEPYYTNPWMQAHFPQINRLFLGILMIFCFISTFVITALWARRLAKELMPIFEVSEKMSQQNLDFDIGKSKIKEFNAVLNALEKMKVALSESLKKNWAEEENRKNRISALTHDIKTPISIIQGNAELLKETNLTEEQNEHVAFITKNATRISEYVNTLMVVNRSEGINDMTLENFPVSIFVEKVMALAKEITSVYGLLLSESIHYEDSSVMVDWKHFEKAFMNILSNAVQYGPEKSTLELMIATQADSLEISLLDQGCGFSNEDLRHATEQFYQGDKSRHSASNYGLGLYIAQEILKSHGGNIQLSNREKKKGAKVSMFLPLN